MEGGRKEEGCLWVGVGVGVDGTASTVVSRKGWRWVTMSLPLSICSKILCVAICFKNLLITRHRTCGEICFSFPHN
jgi:hypothetical protein